MLTENVSKAEALSAEIGASCTLEDKAMLEHGLEIGRGGFWLSLTGYQYQKL